MSAITSNAVDGNWNSIGSWAGGVIPGDGDTVTFANGAVIRVPNGVSITIGSSPADDTGTPAMQSNGTTGTGRLIVETGGTLIWKGPVRQANGNWVVQDGATLTYGGGDGLYSWKIGLANNQSNALLSFGTSSGSGATINSTGNRSLGFGNIGTSFQDGGCVEWYNSIISKQGANSTAGLLVQSRLNSSFAKCIVKGCLLDSNGMINITAVGAASTFDVSNNKLTNPDKSSTANSYSIQIDATLATKTTGTRKLSNNEIYGRVSLLGTGSVQTGIVVEYNTFRVDPAGTVSLNCFNLNTGGGLESFKENLFFISTNSALDPSTLWGFGTCQDSYIFRQVNNSGTGNNHPVYCRHDGGNLIIQRCIIHSAVFDVAGDLINFTNDPTVNRTLSVNNCLFLANVSGNVAGSLVLQQGAVTQDNDSWTFNHNTIIGGNASSSTLAFGVAAENVATFVAGPPSSVASVQSNLIYRATSGLAYLVQPHSSAVINNGSLGTANYNATHNVTNDIYTPVDAKFAAAPGTNDITGDPLFVDSTRSILTFDRGYLGNAVGTAWINGTAYAVGDVVSVSESTYYGGQTINWRCIVAHTSATATDRPTTGSGWCGKWEPAAVKLIADDMRTGNLYGGKSLTGKLTEWTLAGFAPTSSTYNPATNPGHDGLTRGAVEYVTLGVPNVFESRVFSSPIAV